MKAFFQEDSKLSMGRLLSFLTVIIGLAVAVIVAFKGNATTSTATICLGLVSAGLGSKVLGKMKEIK
jgi:hypothetical protein